jgi:hypothetical protein
MRSSENVVISRNHRKHPAIQQPVIGKHFAGKIEIVRVGRADEVTRDDNVVTSIIENSPQEDFQRFDVFAVISPTKMRIGNVRNGER